MLSDARWASWPPPAIRASVASTPGPPALVTIARRGPLSRGWVLRISAMLNSSEIRSTRNTPQRRKAASSTSSLPVMDPVCATAAWDASSVRPVLMTMMGLVNATSRTAERNNPRRRSTPCR